MDRFTVTLDAYNSRQDFPSQRVTLTVDAWDSEDVVRRIGTVYVSRDGKTVNNTGGIGDGYWYPEWEAVSVDLAHADYPHEPGRLYDCAACESQCFCGDNCPMCLKYGETSTCRERHTECVYSGEHATNGQEPMPGDQDYDDDDTEF